MAICSPYPNPPVTAGCLALALLATAAPARAASETVVYAFQGSDGHAPEAGLTNVGGTLYGTTFSGGPPGCGHGGCGTVFSVTPAGVHTIVYAFKGRRDGAHPQGGLISVGDKLYGTTYDGGVGDHGTVFKLTTAGVKKVLYSFKGGSDGANPEAGLINVGGTLYGTSYAGGASNDGTVFKVTRAGAETVLYAFQGGSDGANPEAGLINVAGTLYGTTFAGGNESTYCRVGGNTCGTVFQVTAAGAETVLYSFKGYPSGGNPKAGLINVRGALYGTTFDGGAADAGTVFKLTTTGIETVVYSFGSQNNDGASPEAGLINVGGTLYGTTAYGGTFNCGGLRQLDGCGTVFKVTKGGAETVVYSFQGYVYGASNDGDNPQAGVINASDTLYGTTRYGGGLSKCSYGCGTVFAITP